MDQHINNTDFFILFVGVVDLIHSHDECQTGIDAGRHSVAGQNVSSAHEMDF